MLLRTLYALSLLCFTFMTALPASAQESVLFVGGAPLDTTQPRFIVPLLEEAFARNNIEFHVKSLPSPRSLEMSNSGQADGELHRVYEFHEVSDGRFGNLVRVESQLMSVYLAVFSKRKNKAITSWEDLKGHIVGYQRGRQNVKTYLKEENGDIIASPQNTELGLFKMLVEGRVDYAVSESFEGLRLLRTHPEFNMIAEVGRLKETKIYSYMHVKHAELAKKIGHTLDEMKIDGTFDRIASKIQRELLAE